MTTHKHGAIGMVDDEVADTTDESPTNCSQSSAPRDD